MRYWKYKAYDADGETIEGVIHGDQPVKLIVQLRQTGLQVFDMVTIQPKEYRRAKRLETRINRLQRLQATAVKGAEEQPPEEATALPAHWALGRAKLRQEHARVKFYVTCGLLLAAIVTVLLILIAAH